MTRSTLGVLGTGLTLLIACGGSHTTTTDGDIGDGTSTDTSSMSADNGSESSPIGEQEPTNSTPPDTTAADAPAAGTAANPSSDANATSGGSPESQEASMDLAADTNADPAQADGTSVDNASPSETSTEPSDNPSTETQTTGNGATAADDQAQSTDATAGGEPNAPPVTEDGAAPDDNAMDPDTADTVPSWTDDVLPFFAASCGSDNVACHSKEVFAGQVASDCRGWLSLDNSPLGSTYLGDFQNGQATGCPDVPLYERLLSTTWQCDDLPYVNPEDPENSYLYRKIAGGPYCPNGDVPSDPMPQVGSLEPAQIEMVRRWIEAGAPYDGP